MNKATASTGNPETRFLTTVVVTLKVNRPCLLIPLATDIWSGAWKVYYDTVSWQNCKNLNIFDWMGWAPCSNGLGPPSALEHVTELWKTDESHTEMQCRNTANQTRKTRLQRQAIAKQHRQHNIDTDIDDSCAGRINEQHWHSVHTMKASISAAYHSKQVATHYTDITV